MRWSRVLSIVEAHAEGEVGKVITGGVGDVPGATMFEKRHHLATERDDIRRLVLSEPRGAVSHNANILLPATDPAADIGYVIMESTEYPVMSGSNTICTATVVLETGILPMTEPVTHLVLESPAGLIPVECACADGKVTSVRFTNQPAFVYHLDAAVEVGGLGRIVVDVAWGGMAYVLIDAAALGFDLTPDETRDLCGLGETIKAAARDQLPAVHPVSPDFPGITIASFVGPLSRTGTGDLTAKNAVVVSPGRTDRSPCGTGTSARLAVLHAKGLIEPGETFRHRSPLGTVFDSRIESLTTVGGVPAVVPSVAGQAWITELSQVGYDPSDPFPTGYALSDTWPNPV